MLPEWQRKVAAEWECAVNNTTRRWKVEAVYLPSYLHYKALPLFKRIVRTLLTWHQTFEHTAKVKEVRWAGKQFPHSLKEEKYLCCQTYHLRLLSSHMRQGNIREDLHHVLENTKPYVRSEAKKINFCEFWQLCTVKLESATDFLRRCHK